MNNSIKKRPLKEANEVREMALLELENFEITGHDCIGKTSEGLVFKDSNSKFLVVKVIVKSLDFDGDFEVTDYENSQAEKALEKIAKAEKVAKAKAKAEKEKALATPCETCDDGDEDSTDGDEESTY